MASKLRRRTVYLGTIVGAVALLAGFALAATLTTQSISSGQNAYSANFGNTVWKADESATPTVAPGVEAVGTCGAVPGTAGTASLSAASPSATEVYGLNGTGHCIVGDFTEVWTFSISAPSGLAATDVFTVTAVWGGPVQTPYSAVVSATVTASNSAATATTETLSLVVDFGTLPSPGVITSLNVVVSGS